MNVPQFPQQDPADGAPFPRRDAARRAAGAATNGVAPISFSPTARQADLLRFVVGYQAAHGGVSPSFIEMRDGIGLASKGGIVRLLDGMEERGLIRRLGSRARAIEVLAPISFPRAPDGAPLFFVTPVHAGEVSHP